MTQPTKPWLVKNLIRQDTFGVISGAEGSYKSFLALDLAYAVAEGREFLGQETQQGEVLYILGERGGDQKHRIRALEIEKRIEPAKVKFITRPFFLDVEEDEQLLVNSIQAHGLRPKLILIDTLRRNMAGEENSNDDMQAWVNAVDRIRGRYGATVMAVCHVNKQTQRIRGASALPGAIDTELYVRVKRPSNPAIHVYTRKQSNFAPTRYALSRKVVPTEAEESSVVLNLVATSYETTVEDDDEEETLPLAEVAYEVIKENEAIGYTNLFERVRQVSPCGKERLNAALVELGSRIEVEAGRGRKGKIYRVAPSK